MPPEQKLKQQKESHLQYESHCAGQVVEQTFLEEKLQATLLDPVLPYEEERQAEIRKDSALERNQGRQKVFPCVSMKDIAG